MKINPDDYIELTSFTHHPFYTWFALEVCDNWRGSRSFNVPIDELMAVVDNALDNGYTVCWGADVSHSGFTRNGLAILVDEQATKAGSDQEHWVGKEEGMFLCEVAWVARAAVDVGIRTVHVVIIIGRTLTAHQTGTVLEH